MMKLAARRGGRSLEGGENQAEMHDREDKSESARKLQIRLPTRVDMPNGRETSQPLDGWGVEGGGKIGGGERFPSEALEQKIVGGY